MDPEYRKMMTWALVALILALLLSFGMVEWVVRRLSGGLESVRGGPAGRSPPAENGGVGRPPLRPVMSLDP